jgi:fermentation-respiration switch protein FrsA (DUF1100 family)
MYDLSRIAGNGYFDERDDAVIRTKMRQNVSAQRTADYANGTYALMGGCLSYPAPDDTPQYVKDYSAYYKTARGYHARSLNSNDGWQLTGSASRSNMHLLAYIGEIDRAVMVLHGEKAHSYYMGKTAYEAMAAGDYPENKKLVTVPGAVHCDLYDGGPDAKAGKGGFIPWDKLVSFFKKNLA